MPTKGPSEFIVDNADEKWLMGKTPAPKIKLDEWNTFEVIANGNKLVHKVNGKIYTEIIDHNQEGRAMKGVLAFQVHRGSAMRVQFKDIELKRLPAGGVLSLADAPLPAGAKKAPGRGGARRNPRRSAGNRAARPAAPPFMAWPARAAPMAPINGCASLTAWLTTLGR